MTTFRQRPQSRVPGRPPPCRPSTSRVTAAGQARCLQICRHLLSMTVCAGRFGRGPTSELLHAAAGGWVQPPTLASCSSLSQPTPPSTLPPPTTLLQPCSTTVTDLAAACMELAMLLMTGGPSGGMCSLEAVSGTMPQDPPAPLPMVAAPTAAPASGSSCRVPACCAPLPRGYNQVGGREYAAGAWMGPSSQAGHVTER